ncbi:MAG: hypothetical protein K8J31_24945, partial [Anaerolineae bacterium]|nr:hypothetical protein [Anaerolineae bacterium]
ASVIPLIRQLGFDGVYVAQAEGNDIGALRQAADGQLSFMGGIPVSWLDDDARPADVSAALARLGECGGDVVGVSGEMNDNVSISHFLSLVGALSSIRI